MRPLLALLFATALLVGRELSAQDPPAPAPPHTTVAGIRELDNERLDAGEPVILHGTVVFSGIQGFTLHDGTYGIQVNLGPEVPRPPVGALVAVEGATGSNRPADRLYPLVVAESFVQNGLSAPPIPIETSIRELASFRHWDQFVAVEAFVLDHAWTGGNHHLLLGAHDGWAVIHVRNTPRESFPDDLVGARIRARGINQGYNHSPMNAMMVTSPEHWQILDLGSEDPFSIPSTSLSEIANANAPEMPLVKVRGTVLHVSPQNHLYVREEGGAGFRVSIFSPLEKPDPAKGLASSVEPFPGATVGDEIEAVGIVADMGTDVGIRFCQVRVTTPGAANPTPIATTIAEVLEGRVTNQIVSLEGRLVEKHRSDGGGGRTRTILVLEDDSRLLHCELDSVESDPYPNFRLNDLIATTGLIPGSPNRAPLRLVLAAKDNAVSRGLSPEILLRRFWIWAGVATSGIGLLFLWIGSLRRSLVRAEKAEGTVRELNSTLEDRVRERTSELEAARSELDRALGQERELGQLKNRFVAMVSHEFRTPLGMTMSALELLRHHRARLSAEKQGELLDDIFSATLRMSGLMEQILVLGRADSGKMNLCPVPLDLPKLARQIGAETLASTGRAKPIEFDFAGELAPVALDESLLRLILGNLLSNAVKYSPEDGVVRLLASREGDRLALEIVDEGIGIPTEDQRHLFEAFHRASNVGEISGTGLGLVLVKRCVEIHLGTLEFESEPGRGTHFRITLPVDPGKA